MQVCGYVGYRAYDFVVLTDMHLAEALLFSHPMPVGIRVLVFWFLSHPMPLRIWSLRIVEVQVPWITKDHESVLDCWRLVLSAVCVSLEFV